MHQIPHTCPGAPLDNYTGHRYVVSLVNTYSYLPMFIHQVWIVILKKAIRNSSESQGHVLVNLHVAVRWIVR